MTPCWIGSRRGRRVAGAHWFKAIGSCPYPVGNGLTYRLRIEEGGSGVLETREREDGSVTRRAPDLFAVAVFVVKNGYLYEFDYAVPQPGPEEVFPSSSVFDLAEENVRKFMSGFTPVTPSE